MKHILVIDDEPDVLELLAELLSTRYQVSTATNGAAALSLLEHVDAVDCIVLDLMMPTMSGEEFAQRLRQHDQTTPLIVASARHDASDIASKLGAEGCLVKPYTSRALIEKIENATSGPTNGSAAPSEPGRMNAASRPPDVKSSSRSPLEPSVNAPAKPPGVKSFSRFSFERSSVGVTKPPGVKSFSRSSSERSSVGVTKPPGVKSFSRFSSERSSVGVAQPVKLESFSRFSFEAELLNRSAVRRDLQLRP